jgi:mannan endo-1,6-alpha-mannosidase
MMEEACESVNTCNPDQRTFKAYLSRWLAVTAQIAPFSAGQIMPLLQSSAAAAVNVCTSGSPDGVACGRKWYESKDDGTRDIGNQMSAMSVVQSNLVLHVAGPADGSTGTSIGNPAAGGLDRPTTNDEIIATRPVTTGDKAGGWLLTIVLITFLTGGAGFLCSSDEELETLTNLFMGRARVY